MQLKLEEYLERINGGSFDLQEFFKYGKQKYTSKFHEKVSTKTLSSLVQLSNGVLGSTIHNLPCPWLLLGRSLSSIGGEKAFGRVDACW